MSPNEERNAMKEHDKNDHGNGHDHNPQPHPRPVHSPRPHGS
jgi:hypothetical protein